MAKLLILISLVSFISSSMSYSGDQKMNALCGIEPCPIIKLHDPTCGSDGKVYSNEFEIECINDCSPPEEAEVKIADPSLCEPEWTNIIKYNIWKRGGKSPQYKESS